MVSLVWFSTNFCIFNSTRHKTSSVAPAESGGGAKGYRLAPT